MMPRHRAVTHESLAAMSALPSGVQYLTRAAAGQLDSDAHETREWLEAFDAIVQREGKDRAQYLFDRLADHAVLRGVQSARARVTQATKRGASDSSIHFDFVRSIRQMSRSPPGCAPRARPCKGRGGA